MGPGQGQRKNWQLDGWASYVGDAQYRRPVAGHGRATLWCIFLNERGSYNH